MINHKKITEILTDVNKEDAVHTREILAKAKELKGLSLKDAAILTEIVDTELLNELFQTAKWVKNEVYGNRLVLFAPLYISNYCANECLYCAFRASNKSINRCTLSQDQIANETEQLINQGQKRLLLVAGEHHAQNSFQYILDSIKTIYNTKNNHGEIRRININIAPLVLDDFKRLHDAQIGTYQLFQETYHPDIYSQVHVAGKKSDYNWRLTAIDRAMQAGIDDVGIGALFGLADWRFELLALLEHTNYLESNFGVGPHTISVPRIEPATGSDLSSNPPNAVNDIDFCKLVAILRLAVPFTGLIMSTRETPEMRHKTLELGVSQISAGSRTNPGGYSENETDSSQFSLGDHRSIDEVIRDVASLDYIPSFCTACYRLGRTGERFMELAKSGKIKSMCHPNAIATFQEYLEDYGSPETKTIGEKLISKELNQLPEKTADLVSKMVAKIKSGKRDVYI